MTRTYSFKRWVMAEDPHLFQDPTICTCNTWSRAKEVATTVQDILNKLDALPAAEALNMIFKLKNKYKS